MKMDNSNENNREDIGKPLQNFSVFLPKGFLFSRLTYCVYVAYDLSNGALY